MQINIIHPSHNVIRYNKMVRKKTAECGTTMHSFINMYFSGQNDSIPDISQPVVLN